MRVPLIGVHGWLSCSYGGVEHLKLEAGLCVIVSADMVALVTATCVQYS